MHRFCDHVRTSGSAAESASLLRERRVDLIGHCGRRPLPPARGRVESDAPAVLHMQSVGAASDGDELFPDFVYGGWWHIGLRRFRRVRGGDGSGGGGRAAAAAIRRPSGSATSR